MYTVSLQGILHGTYTHAEDAIAAAREQLRTGEFLPSEVKVLQDLDPEGKMLNGRGRKLPEFKGVPSYKEVWTANPPIN